MGTNRYNHIKKWIQSDSRVLDLGCGDGALLDLLVREKAVSAMGIDMEENALMACLERGLNVFKGNLDQGLKDYGDQSYDYVILSQTLQQVQHPIFVLKEMMRVGKQAVVSVPNFGHLINRLQLLFKGRMPVNKDLPYQWYDTPNIHLCTRRDFHVLCEELQITILDEVSITGKNRSIILPNLMASESLFLLKGKTNS